MKRQYCDRCKSDVTDVKSGHLGLIGDADTDGNGSVTNEWDICGACMRLLKSFMKPKAR